MPLTPILDKFIDYLCQATAQIGDHYFQLPVAGKEDPIYRERVYCYELYHQLHMVLEKDRDLSFFVLSAEIDKGGHPVIRKCAPDLVFHNPGYMENAVVVEVKPINADAEGIRKDREILEYFLSPEVGYRLGVELVYGGDESALDRFREVFRETDHERVQLFWHRRAGEPARRIL